MYKLDEKNIKKETYKKKPNQVWAEIWDAVLWKFIIFTNTSIFIINKKTCSAPSEIHENQLFLPTPNLKTLS